MIAALPGTAGCIGRPQIAKSTVVLVHGAWHGAWCWDRLVPLLRNQDCIVHAPTLPGLGERRAELSSAITLDTHVSEIAGLLASLQLSNVVLVGHSYGGVVITGVADREALRIRRLIYLDALTLDHGESLSSIIGTERWGQMTKAAQEHGAGVGLPSPPAAAFGVLDPSDAAFVTPRLTLQPINTFAQTLQLKHPFGNGLPKVYIDCNDPSMAAVAPFKARVRSQSDWIYESLATGHDAMLSAPTSLAELLLKHA